MFELLQFLENQKSENGENMISRITGGESEGQEIGRQLGDIPDHIPETQFL